MLHEANRLIEAVHTLRRNQDQLCDDLGWDVSLARLSLLLPLEARRWGDGSVSGFPEGNYMPSVSARNVEFNS